MLLIELKPTKRLEIVNGVQFRVYEGRTNTGVALEMLGLFRIADVAKREEFTKAVCAVSPGDPQPVRILHDPSLVKP